MDGLGAPPGESFYARDTVRVARSLLGCLLESTIGGARTAGRIVEVEAYVGADDPADHGFGHRLTERNAALFGPPGIAYVFLSYGVHWCFNAVTEAAGRPTAVLVRALEPVAGLDAMARRRGVDDERVLCAGPGRLTQALHIDRAVNGGRLDRPPLRILQPSGTARVAVATGPRIGVSRGRDRPLRFAELGSPWLSRPI